MKKNNGTKKKKYVAPENVYDLDKEHTYKTLAERPGRYAGSPGAATVDLSSKKEKPKVIDVDNDNGEMSVLSNLSTCTREELIS